MINDSLRRMVRRELARRARQDLVYMVMVASLMATVVSSHDAPAWAYWASLVSGTVVLAGTPVYWALTFWMSRRIIRRRQTVR